MNVFSLRVFERPKKINGILSCTGQITIGKFKETFGMPLNSWSLKDYQQQWKEGLERMKTHDVSCLVVSIENLASGYPTIELWTLHRQGDSIFFHNQLLFDETTGHFPMKLSDFNSSNCYEFINPRIANEDNQAINEDGEKISEWHFSTKDFFELVR